MSKFKDYFHEWVMFDDGHTFVVSAEEYNKSQALELLKSDVLTWPKYQNVSVNIQDIRDDRVRFGFSEYGDTDFEGKSLPLWCLPSKGMGSKPVWVIDMWNVTRPKENEE